MAARRGIQTVSGVEMFVAQGAEQWKIWTGDEAPVGADASCSSPRALQ